jgi:hypothetical protein
LYTKVSEQVVPANTKSFPSQLPLCENSLLLVPVMFAMLNVSGVRTAVAVNVIVWELVVPMSVVGNATELSDHWYVTCSGAAEATPEVATTAPREPATTPKRSDTPNAARTNFVKRREIRRWF